MAPPHLEAAGKHGVHLVRSNRRLCGAGAVNISTGNSQIDSDSTVVNAFDAETTPIGSVKQRVSLRPPRFRAAPENRICCSHRPRCRHRSLISESTRRGPHSFELGGSTDNNCSSAAAGPRRPLDAPQYQFDQNAWRFGMYSRCRKRFLFRFRCTSKQSAVFSRDFHSRILISEIKFPESRRAAGFRVSAHINISSNRALFLFSKS